MREKVSYQVLRRRYSQIYAPIYTVQRKFMLQNCEVSISFLCGDQKCCRSWSIIARAYGISIVTENFRIFMTEKKSREKKILPPPPPKKKNLRRGGVTPQLQILRRGGGGLPPPAPNPSSWGVPKQCAPLEPPPQKLPVPALSYWQISSSSVGFDYFNYHSIKPWSWVRIPGGEIEKNFLIREAD